MTPLPQLIRATRTGGAVRMDDLPAPLGEGPQGASYRRDCP